MTSNRMYVLAAALALLLLGIVLPRPPWPGAGFDGKSRAPLVQDPAETRRETGI